MSGFSASECRDGTLRSCLAVSRAGNRSSSRCRVPIGKSPFALFLSLLLLSTPLLHAEDPTNLAAVQDEIVAKLYGPIERPAEIDHLAERAATLKVPDQTIAEARVAFAIRTRTLDARLEETVRQLDQLCQSHAWRREDSRLCNSDTEAEGLLFFARALLADRDHNDTEYERCIKEAFWMNPGSGPILAGELRAHRDLADLLQLRVPMHKPFKNSAGETKTLDDLTLGNNGLLLIFWTSDNDLSGDVIATLTSDAARLVGQKIVTVGINVQDLRANAELVRRAHGIQVPWLVDSIDRPMAKILRVTQVPTAVLVDVYGRVHYHGFPRSAALDSALRDLGVDAPGH